MLELAAHIVNTKTGHFEPSKFEDQYEDALKGDETPSSSNLTAEAALTNGEMLGLNGAREMLTDEPMSPVGKKIIEAPLLQTTRRCGHRRIAHPTGCKPATRVSSL